jgi:hypothetical protein
MPESTEPAESESGDETVKSEALPAVSGEEGASAGIEWIRKNPSVPVAVLAVIVSIMAFVQSHRSADIAEGQLKLASRPLLYGTCSFTRSDFLKLSPIPDAVMIAEPNVLVPALQVQTLTKTVPIIPPYEKMLPWVVDRCSITNTGRGTAQGITFELNTMFIDLKTQTPTSGKTSQSLVIDFLASGASYDFIVANQRNDTALILMPQTVTYQVGLTGEIVSEPLVHSAFWNQLTLDNRRKPQNLKPGE